MTRYEYDALNRVVSMTDANGGVTSYEYDAVGNLVVPAYGPAFEDYIQLAPDETDEEGEASFYPELETNRFGQKEGIKGGVVSPVFLRRDVHVRSAMVTSVESSDKREGSLLKKESAVTASAAQKNTIKSIKQAVAGAVSKISKTKSKAAAVLNRSAEKLRTAAAQKQAAATKKTPASLAPLSARHTLTTTAPSVKAVVKAPVSCSAQAAVGSGIVFEGGITFWEAIQQAFQQVLPAGVAVAMADSPAPGPADVLGLIVAGFGTVIFASGTYVYRNWIQPYITSEPQGPTIFDEPRPDILSPQIETIPELEPDVGSEIPPFPSSTEEDDSNITSIPLPEEEGVHIITADGSGESSQSNPWDVYTQQIIDESIDVSNWNQGSFDSVEESVARHYYKHGEEVGASSVEQYLRKADGFKSNLRGATTSYVDGEVDGVIRYKKNGRYIDLAPDGSIISFGKAY